MLSINSLSKSFGGIKAIQGVDIEVAAGTVHGIIGPNGAGKTTLFNIISGLFPPTAGSLVLEGHDITALRPYMRTRLGVARTFQNIRIFPDMTVIENVITGMHVRLKSPFASALFRSSAEERQAKHAAEALLVQVGLADKAYMPSASLPYGDQRRLEIARALACEPKLLLLDEPAAGMNPAETSDLAVLLNGIKRIGITLLLVEHDMNFVMKLCDQITVLNFGRKIAEGDPTAVRNDSAVIEAYLGPKVAESLKRGAAV